MENQKKVLVCISGGLDSSYTAYLLKKRGFHVDGIHFSNGLVVDSTTATINKIAEFLGITIKFVDIRDKFEELLDRVDIEMCHMKTPNICVMCARDIKFGYVMKYALENGYDFLATGHYVQIIHCTNGIIVRRAYDDSRDQSYGFGVIPKENLMHALTPLGEYLKADIYRHANAMELPFIQKESRGLCFTNEPFSMFYQKFTKRGLIPGNFIVDGTKCSLQHCGQQLYTRGQKVTVGKYQRVVNKKDSDGNIVLSERKNVYENIVKITDLNFMIGRDKIRSDKEYQILIRYNANLVNCHIIKLLDNVIYVETKTPVFAPTPGQIGTIYDEDNILVGGFIYTD